eukprot:365091-Chlamydomonas_euryale.AAC.10
MARGGWVGGWVSVALLCGLGVLQGAEGVGVRTQLGVLAGGGGRGMDPAQPHCPAGRHKASTRVVVADAGCAACIATRPGQVACQGAWAWGR